MKFGTSGLRGLVTDMDDAVCAAYAAAFLRHLEDAGVGGGEVLVGRDLRPSSPRIAAACLGAVAAAGLRAVDCGPAPTPALALEAARRGAAAIMVTGSHIPFDRNGLKFYRPDGEITKTDEDGVLRALAAGAVLRPGGATATDAGVGQRYLERMASAFPADLLAGRRIGVYQHSAVGRDLMATLFARLGAEVIALGRADGFVPIDTEAVRPEDAALAQRWTAEHRLDALVSTDGDGDRPLIADEQGVFLRGDVLGILTARFLGADAVATPISSTTALERCGWFARIARTRIGSPYVIAAMAQQAAEGARLPVAFEANGGFLLGAATTAPTGAALAALPTRDALLPMLGVLAMAIGQGAPLSALAAGLPARFTASDRLEHVEPARSGPLLAALAADPAVQARLLGSAQMRPLDLGAVAAVDLLDGVRMTFRTEDVVHLRASGNAPELRCYAEAATAARAADMVARALAWVSGAL